MGDGVAQLRKLDKGRYVLEARRAGGRPDRDRATRRHRTETATRRPAAGCRRQISRTRRHEGKAMMLSFKRAAAPSSTSRTAAGRSGARFRRVWIPDRASRVRESTSCRRFLQLASPLSRLSPSRKPRRRRSTCSSARTARGSCPTASCGHGIPSRSSSIATSARRMAARKTIPAAFVTDGAGRRGRMAMARRPRACSSVRPIRGSRSPLFVSRARGLTRGSCRCCRLRPRPSRRTTPIPSPTSITSSSPSPIRSMSRRSRACCGSRCGPRRASMRRAA